MHSCDLWDIFIYFWPGGWFGCFTQSLIIRSCGRSVQSCDVCFVWSPLDVESEDSSVQLGDQDEDVSMVSLL